MFTADRRRVPLAGPVAAVGVLGAGFLPWTEAFGVQRSLHETVDVVDRIADGTWPLVIRSAVALGPLAAIWCLVAAALGWRPAAIATGLLAVGITALAALAARATGVATVYPSAVAGLCALAGAMLLHALFRPPPVPHQEPSQ